MVAVVFKKMDLQLIDDVNPTGAAQLTDRNLLQINYVDGMFVSIESFEEIRNRLKRKQSEHIWKIT